MISSNMITLIGRQPGVTSIILVGVHGNERCGIEALERLLPNLIIKSGTVFIGYGNPRAITQNVRFTQANLNRMFQPDDQLTATDLQSYEYGRAQELKPYLAQATALLDIHASSIPKSRVFAICEASAKELIPFLPVDLVVSGFDSVEPGGTDYYMNSLGNMGICMECGFLGDPMSTKIAENSIVAFLKARGHLSGTVSKWSQRYLRMYYKYYTKTNQFILSKAFENFEVVKRNQVLGIDGTTKVTAPRDSVILFAHSGSIVGSEAFLLGTYQKSLR